MPRYYKVWTLSRFEPSRLEHRINYPCHPFITHNLNRIASSFLFPNQVITTSINYGSKSLHAYVIFQHSSFGWPRLYLPKKMFTKAMNNIVLKCSYAMHNMNHARQYMTLTFTMIIFQMSANFETKFIIV